MTYRQEEIVEILKNEQYMSVKELAKRLFVSDMTIRRDLIILEQRGDIRRYHGGAILLDDEDLSFEMRINISSSEKKKIAQKVLKYIDDDTTIFIDSSSTCFFLLPFIRKYMGLKIVTSSIKILLEAAKLNIPVILCGGSYVSRDMRVQGASACEFLSKLNFDVAIFSSKGVSENGDITDDSEDSCALKKVVIKNSKMNLFIYDHTKYGKKYLYKICDSKDATEIFIEKN